MKAPSLKLDPGNTNLDVLQTVCDGPVTLSLNDKSFTAIDAAQKTVAKLCASDHPTYGINTGFGKLANQSISPDKLTDLQHNLLLSHCCGVGDLLEDNVVRLMMVLKILSLSRGFSGVRRELVEALIYISRRRCVALYPTKGFGGCIR